VREPEGGAHVDEDLSEPFDAEVLDRLLRAGELKEGVTDV